MTRASQIVNFTLYFLLFFVLQVLLFLHLSLFDGYALCFFYIGFILMLPYQVSPVGLILAGFATGFMVDIFYNTGGIHAAATVLVAFLRPYIIKFLTPSGGYDEGVSLSIGSLGAGWYIPYAAIMILIHHVALFSIWSLGYGNIFLTMGKIIASSIFSLLVIVLFQYLIQSPKRN